MSVRILIGDCRERLKELPDASVDSAVCDPPYHLTGLPTGTVGYKSSSPNGKAYDRSKMAHAKRGFMGQTWDGGDVAFQPETWAEVLRVLKPGAHLVAFSGTRTYHRMVCAIEDAGFEIRDQLAWVYGSGFPKSHDVSKGIDATILHGGSNPQKIKKAIEGRPGDGRKTSTLPNNGIANRERRGGSTNDNPTTDAAREWQGWGTALKPAWEPICLARKPLVGTVAANVLAHGTGAINVDGCRVDGAPPKVTGRGIRCAAWRSREGRDDIEQETREFAQPSGRWPANIIHDGSDEVLAGFPESKDGIAVNRNRGEVAPSVVDFTSGHSGKDEGYGGEGSAARFFYCAKTTTEERGDGNNHPTVKPIDLMRWLCRLVTPKGGTVLDPFAGSGSTLVAADAEQFNAIGCELSPDYAAIAEARVRKSAGLFAEVSAS